MLNNISGNYNDIKWFKHANVELWGQSVSHTWFGVLGGEKQTVFMHCISAETGQTEQLRFPSHAPHFIVPASTNSRTWASNTRVEMQLGDLSGADPGRHCPQRPSLVGEHAVFRWRFSKLHRVHLLQGATSVSELNVPSSQGMQTCSPPSPKPQSWKGCTTTGH